MLKLLRFFVVLALLAASCDRVFAATMITENFVFSYSTDASYITLSNLSYSSPSSGNLLTGTYTTPGGGHLLGHSGTFSQIISVAEGVDYTSSANVSSPGGTTVHYSVSVSPVPLPGSSLLFMMALAGFGLVGFLSTRQTKIVAA